MSDFVRLPDGSLILTGDKVPPSLWDRIKAGASAILPERFNPKPAPWWIPAPQTVQARPAPPPVAASRPVPSAKEWGEAESETLHRQRINEAMGTFPGRVLASKYFVGE